MPGKYLGTLLVERGVLEPNQVQAVLSRQHQTGQPFGQTAVMMYNIRMADVWRAFAQQKADSTPHVNLDDLPLPDKSAIDLIPARLAWAARVLPIRFLAGRLLCATTQRAFTDALAHLHERLDLAIDFVIVDELQLKQHIMQNYPV